MPMGISSAATRWWLRPVGGNFRRQLGAPSAFIVAHENVLNAMVTPGAAIDLVHSASVTGEIEALNTLIDVVPVGDVHRGWHVGRAWNTAESRLTESP